VHGGPNAVSYRFSARLVPTQEDVKEEAMIRGCQRIGLLADRDFYRFEATVIPAA
jgi:hypothetical protein